MMTHIKFKRFGKKTIYAWKENWKDNFVVSFNVFHTIFFFATES